MRRTGMPKNQDALAKLNVILECLKDGDLNKHQIASATKFKLSSIEYCLHRLAVNNRVFKIRQAVRNCGSQVLWTIDEERASFPRCNLEAKIAPKQDVNEKLANFMGVTTHTPTKRGRIFLEKDSLPNTNPVKRSESAGVRSYYNSVNWPSQAW